MDTQNSEFYNHYKTFKGYETPRLKLGDRLRFDRDFWARGKCHPAHSVIEVGSGTGLFLLYLKEKGVTDFLGIDSDPALGPHIPDAVSGHFIVVDIREFLQNRGGRDAGGPKFDRIALFDVLEHFSAHEGLFILQGLKNLLKPGGRIVVRLPNVSSPWGLGYQFGDLTHRCAYTPGSLVQMGLSAGLSCQGVYPVRPVNPVKWVIDGVVHWVASQLLATPPKIWTANMLGVFLAEEEAEEEDGEVS